MQADNSSHMLAISYVFKWIDRWTPLLLWITALTSVSFLLRNLFFPWLLQRLSRHMRVRSVSLWSIRGLYIHTGNQIFRVERISYRWSNGFSVRLHGLGIEVAKPQPKFPVMPANRHIRNLTLADLSPTPLAQRAIARLYIWCEPYLRPVLRTLAVSVLRSLMRWIPQIISKVTFDLQDTSFTAPELPGTVRIQKIILHANLVLTQLEKSVDSGPMTDAPRLTRAKRSYSVTAWRNRLTDSFQRSLDRAWGQAQGTVSLEFILRNIVGSGGIDGSIPGALIEFFRLPSALKFQASMEFDPREAVIKKRSLCIKLDIGDCFIVLDSLNALLTKLKQFQPEPQQLSFRFPDLPTPVSGCSASSIASVIPPMSPSSGSVFSPSPSFVMPRKSHPTTPLEPLETSLSPTSPLLNVLSASLRSRRRKPYRPRKLKYAKDKSLLAILDQFIFEVSTITFSVPLVTGTGHYKGVIQSIAFSSGLIDDPSQDNYLKQFLGGRSRSDTFDRDSYGVDFFVKQISLERCTTLDTLQVLTLGQITLRASATQWPAPWLHASPFMCGDPNTALVTIIADIERLEFTERIDAVHQILSHLKSVPKKPQGPLKPFPEFLKIPKILVEFTHGKIRGCLLATGPDGAEPLLIELQNNGFGISASSNFDAIVNKDVSSNAGMDHTHQQPYQMDYNIAAYFEPTSVDVRNNVDNYCCSSPSFGDSVSVNWPSLAFVDDFEIHGQGHAFAFLSHDFENTASVVTSSPVIDVHFSTPRLSIELWHPQVTTALSRILAPIPRLSQDLELPVLSPLSEPKSQEHRQTTFLDRLLSGVSVTFAIGHVIVLVAGPDITPRAAEGLSRGFTCHTTFSLHYSSMHSGHTNRFNGLLHRTQAREQLRLPQQLLVDAISAARASVITHNASAHFRISLSDTVLKSAVRTKDDAAKPSIIEDLSPGPGMEEFTRIPETAVSIRCIGKRGSFPQRSDDSCEITVLVPEISATFELAYAYDMLLALGLLTSLMPPSLPRSTTSKSPQHLVVRFKAALNTIQVLCKLPMQGVAVRFDGMEVDNSMESFTVRISKGVGWVKLPSQVNRWDEDHGDKWEEMLYLQMLNISSPSMSGKMSIHVDGDSAKLQIPFGYIFADLVEDIVVTVKVIKHLAGVTASGAYTPIPTPEAEGPKGVPDLTIRFRCLCAEAADDAFESKLAVIWRCGLEAVKQRHEREAAFSAKVSAISQSGTQAHSPQSVLPDPDYDFDAKHTVPIEDARRRLDEVHELDWTLRLNNLRRQRTESEDAVRRLIQSKHAVKGANTIQNIVEVTPTKPIPPLFRALATGVITQISAPSFPLETLPDFLYERGGLPRQTEFSLLIPLNVHLTLTTLHATLRDYPLPFLSIPAQADSKRATMTFKTDLVIAEEMGSDLSVEWVDCPIHKQERSIPGAPRLLVSVPKTIMPVKTYADADIQVTTSGATLISWAVSLAPAIQDLLKVVDTLTTPPKDSSPAIGFWDKLRLIFHWTLTASFEGEVRFHMKGSRDPYKLSDDGAGFVFSCPKNVKLFLGVKNDVGEFAYLMSDSMIIAVPDLEHLFPHNQRPSYARRIPHTSRPFHKICAKLRSGVRVGAGCIFERTCGTECTKCIGSAFHRGCRYFNFRPHYDVKLEMKTKVPAIRGRDDSYNGFRSDFVHLSFSLVSSAGTRQSASNREFSSIHLTPKVFAHFWAWIDLFDDAFSLPTRQGSYYPERIYSPKLPQHLATLKYRIQIYKLYLTHAYLHESRETWVDGVVPWVGIKGVIDECHVDFHQREEEILVPDMTKVTRGIPIYAAEVALKGLDVRALVATFTEPLRRSIEMVAPPQRSNYRAHKNLPTIDSLSPWYDMDDFVETDWSPSSEPHLHLLPVMNCPHFTYFKRNSATLKSPVQASKFGLEESHTCLLGKQRSVPQIQIAIVTARIAELKKLMRNSRFKSDGGETRTSMEEMIKLLEDYSASLQGTDESSKSAERPSANYLMPTFAVSPDEWAEFGHVYQIHCPTIYIDNAIRDIMIQYYYCSQARKGLEYRMATRAVKFIRDQAELALDDDLFDNDMESSWEPGNSTAQIAASALRWMVRGDQSKPSVEVRREIDVRPPVEFDPLDGWAEGVSLSKSHCCLLLKPQVVLRAEGTKDMLILAALQAKLQAYGIMDENNADDPVSGKVMSRSLTSVSDLQAFAPASSTTLLNVCVPVEVLVDRRCGSDDFDRLVPPTDATFQYDKFNRLRLRNSATSAIKASGSNDSHLHDQTDLIRVHVPRFTVSANDVHFQAISNVVTDLVLFSDAAHKTRLERLQTLLFTYDFTDLASAANIVSDLQHSLNDAMECQQMAVNSHSPRLDGEEGQLELLKLKAHIFLLSEELNFVFDAIKLAQDRFDDHTDQKSALLLHTTSTEISWNMLDDRKDLLAKLMVQNIEFFWLSRQDSATCTNLTVGNLQAFDGSRSATWAEILCKHDDPPNHPLLKRGLFLLANWTVLAPVGGITIYELFELSFHPMRLQIDARVGRRILEYMWPARRQQNEIIDKPDIQLTLASPQSSGRTSLDSPRTLHNIKNPPQSSGTALSPPLRRITTSRSFTDLRDTARETLRLPTLHKSPSTEMFSPVSLLSDVADKPKDDSDKKAGDALEMKNRSSQKSFVLVRISSLHLLLSIAAERSFECRDARIRTRDLEYRNQTWSFEELVNQFIPSDTSWKGWVKIAFHQPLLPVLPVARELFSKTKLIASSRTLTQIGAKGPAPKLNRARALSNDDESKLSTSRTRSWRKPPKKPEVTTGSVTTLPLMDEPDSMDSESDSRPQQLSKGKRLRSLFSRTTSKAGPSDADLSSISARD